ncbi:MAG: hypothetical protein K2G32_10145 [Oscillospiraceae bacterium]|nr:hypothetical protein [Oscillospiraceae bacterium]
MRLYGKEGLRKRLTDIARQDRLPHAILLHGNSGAGKKVMARYIAKLFLCERLNGDGAPPDGEFMPCEQCPACRNINADEHPDVIFVKRTCGGKYSMDEFRAVLAGTVIKPNNGGVKVYVFEDCDMRVQHQNALLKLIEEPAGYLRFIFTCENANSILETILSRVTEFEVRPMSVGECAECLTDGGVEPKRAAELSEPCSGNVGKCLAEIEGGEETKLIDTARKAAAAVSARDKLSTAAALSEQTGRAEFAAVLDYFSDILRDALALRCGGEATSCGKKEAAGIAKAFSEAEILNMLDSVFEVAGNGEINLNLALSAAYLSSKLFL